MKQNKNFAASLIATVGAFMLLPVALFWFANMMETFSRGKVQFISILLVLICLLVVAVFVTETIYAIKARKENGVSKVYNLVTMILNAVLAVLCLIFVIYMMVEMGGFDFEGFIQLCPYYFVFLWGAASFGTAFGFKLYAMLKK